MPQNPCPHWDYESHSRRKAILQAETAAVLSELRAGTLDVKALVADTRPVHQRLFSSLTPAGQAYLAGHYRGEPFPCLRHRPVGIPSNPKVGCPPLQVKLEMAKFAQFASVVISTLDALHAKPDTEASAEDKLASTVAAACRLFAQFLLIHPYANGNGHAGRMMLVALLGRYGYWMSCFTIEPRPFGKTYDDATRDYQNGRPDALEKLVLGCIAAP